MRARRNRPTSSIPAPRRSSRRFPPSTLIGQGRKRFFLLGTDTVYPRTTNAILKSYLNAQGVADEDVAEFYTPFNHKNWEEVVTWIHIYFYRELGRQGITAESLPAMTLSIGEGELPAIAGPEMAGHLAAWSYLHEIDSPENKAFVSAWRRFCNAPNVVTDDPMEATWIGFNLWKEAVSLVRDVRRALGGLRLKAPSGFEVVMDLSNHHLHKPAMIGRITADARFVPIWISQGLVAPEPWSPWLERYDSEPRTAPRRARELAFSHASTTSVIPAQAGIQGPSNGLFAGYRLSPV
jgi:urea transport system substrate-binding protein